LRCAACGCAITAEIKKDRYVYYHCTFDKGSCGGLYVREEELERQFEDILGELQFSEALLDWMREALRQSQKKNVEYHRRAIEKLNAQYAKLQNRIDQIYLDKLDGEVEEAFYRRNVSHWREEQAQIRTRIERHEKADQNYIEQGIRLLELARNAQEFFRTRSQQGRAALLGFILPGSTLRQDRVVPLYPEERECEAPTAARVFEVFTTFQRHHLSKAGKVVQTFLPELKALHRQTLRLLGIPISTFRQDLN